MMTFGKLLNIMHEERESLHHQNSRSMQAIRTGLNVNQNFWEEFIQVCNDSDNLAELLDISSTTIIGWSSKIKESLAKVQKADTKGEGDEKVKSKILDTGDNFSHGIA